MKWLDFDPHVTFLRLKAVTYVIAAILMAAAIITVTIIIATPGLTFNFSSEGWNKALEIFKVPLGLLAVSIPLIALFAANHRSVQSKRQMELTQSQIDLAMSNNQVTNYYKHVDEFQKYIDTHVNKLLPNLHGGSVRIAYPRRLHKMIFPHARSGQLKVDKSFLESLSVDLKKIIDATAVFRAEKYEHRSTQLHVLSEKIDKFSVKYCVDGHRSSGLPQMTERDGQLLGDATIRDYVYPFGQVCTVITQCLQFDESYEIPQIVDQIARFNWESIPAVKINGSMNYFFEHHLQDDTMIMVDDEEF